MEAPLARRRLVMRAVMLSQHMSGGSRQFERAAGEKARPRVIARLSLASLRLCYARSSSVYEVQRRARPLMALFTALQCQIRFDRV